MGRLTALCLLSVSGLVSVLSGQPYSMGLDDNTNLYDAPIPGFVGTGGDGKVSVPGYEDDVNALNGVNPLFLHWADTVVDYSPAPGVDAYWRYSGETLGAVTGDHFAVASLGDLDSAQITSGVAPGTITVSFSEPIRDLAGADFAVFENGFVSLNNTDGGSVMGEVWAELAYVEVSSDGEHFARFPSVSLTPDLVGAYGTIRPQDVYNLAGKHVNAYGESWGTPFDLSQLSADPYVLSGDVDLSAITQIRLVDIPGSGDFLDSLGNPIYDAWVTWGSGGADIEAFGAISQELVYSEWAQGSSWQVSADDDQDGLSNWEEYAFRLNPESAEKSLPAQLEKSDLGELCFVFRRDQRIADVRYVVETTERLGEAESWESIAQFGPLDAQSILQPAQVLAVEERWSSPQASVGVLQEVALELPELGERARFYRVRLESVE